MSDHGLNAFQPFEFAFHIVGIGAGVFVIVGCSDGGRNGHYTAHIHPYIYSAVGLCNLCYF
jgi:hypothetical protein